MPPSTRTRDLGMFAVLTLLGLADTIWLFLRGDMVPVLLAAVATVFAIQQLLGTFNEP